MRRHPDNLTGQIRKLRSEGKTYGEINKLLNIKLAKSTLHWICKDVSLPLKYTARISKLNITNLGIARATALAMNQAKKEEFLTHAQKINQPIAKKIYDKNIAKIALSMLCLGEASKSTSRHSFSLGNSDPRIITLFIKLLDKCFPINYQKIRCTVQCRADQNPSLLTNFWSKHTGIPASQFYKPQIDKRTIGKPTKKLNYKGVLNVYYSDKKIQLELESLANLIYNEHSGPVVQW